MPSASGKTLTFGPVHGNGNGQIYTISGTSDPSAGFFGQLGMKLAPTVTSGWPLVI